MQDGLGGVYLEGNKAVRLKKMGVLHVISLFVKAYLRCSLCFSASGKHLIQTTRLFVQSQSQGCV